MKFFYALMLLLILSSSIIRFAGARSQPAQTAETPVPQNDSGAGGAATARILVFHRENSGTNSCEDLSITTMGDAVYSNCGQGAEKQYVLNDTERTQLSKWDGQYMPINYDKSNDTQTGNETIQLYLNGTGTKQATDTETQQIIDFAEALAKKVASQS